MFSKWRSTFARTFGARIAAWYFALFVVSSLIVIVVAGLLLSVSLARRDRDALAAALIRYTDAYARGGVAVLDSVIAADRAAASYEPIFVRVIANGRTRMLSLPVEWSRFDLDSVEVPPIGGTALQRLGGRGDASLEVISGRLRDGTVFQVGRSTAARDAVLERFRETTLFVLGLIVLTGLAGGLALTNRALQPLNDLRATLTRILQTGRTTERVPVRGTADPLDALGGLVNRMLDRIGGLVTGMRSTLDTVAHDLRTPMTRLRGNAEVALQSGRTVGELREALADCIDEADRVGQLLDALLDLAEAETGAMQLRRDQVDLNALTADVAELYSEVAEEKRLRLATETGAERVMVTGDRVRLSQVVANLVDNAVKYTPAGGEVTISLRRSAASAEIVVTDTGAGIAPEDLPRIWERLYRGDASRSQRGLGIGLSLVRAIVEAHGGRVAVESAIGRGSRFTISLPLQMTQM